MFHHWILLMVFVDLLNGILAYVYLSFHVNKEMSDGFWSNIQIWLTAYRQIERRIDEATITRICSCQGQTALSRISPIKVISWSASLTTTVMANSNFYDRLDVNRYSAIKDNSDTPYRIGQFNECIILQLFLNSYPSRFQNDWFRTNGWE